MGWTSRSLWRSSVEAGTGGSLASMNVQGRAGEEESAMEPLGSSREDSGLEKNGGEEESSSRIRKGMRGRLGPWRLFTAGIELTLRNLPAFYLITFLCGFLFFFSLALVLLAAARLSGYSDPNAFVEEGKGGVLFNLLTLFFFLVFLNLTTGALVYRAVKSLGGERPSIFACLKKALARILPLLAVSFLVVVFSWIASMAFLIPGIWVGTMLSLAVPIVVAEKTGVWRSLNRSASLTRGYKMDIFLASFGYWVLLYLLLYFVGKIPSLSPTFLKLDIIGALKEGLFTVIFVFLFMDIFDTVGTVIGIGQSAGFIKDGKLPRANRVLFSDAVGTTVGALLGTSTVTSYIESAAGVSAGGKTGFASVVTAFLFLISLFFYPFVKMVGTGIQIKEGVTLYPVTAPALIIVGSLIISTIKRIKWDDPTESIPAFLALVGIPLTYNIGEGMAFGFISYFILKLFTGRYKELNWPISIIAIAFILRFIFLTK